jgi:hypothetical protein
MIKMIIVRSEFDQFDDFDRSSSLNWDMDLDSISTTGDSADSNEHEQKLVCHFFRLLPRRFFDFWHDCTTKSITYLQEYFSENALKLTCSHRRRNGFESGTAEDDVSVKSGTALTIASRPS